MTRHLRLLRPTRGMIPKYHPEGLLPIIKQQETKKALPEGGASVIQGSGIKNDGPEPSGLQPETILGENKQIPSRECRTPAVVSEDPGAPEMLTDMLRQAPISEEHHALMVTVVEKVLSAKSGLNEAFSSLLRGFEVCDVVLPIE